MTPAPEQALEQLRRGRPAVLVWHRHADDYAEALNERLPDVSVSSRRPDDPVTPMPDVPILLGWKVPEGALAALPDLVWMQATGAGVDHLLRRDDRPASLVLTRSVGRFGDQAAEYVVGYLLAELLGVERYRDDQRARRWRPRPRRLLEDRTVGVLGLGEVGGTIARVLGRLGARVLGVNRSGDPVAGVDAVWGREAWRTILPRCDVLVVALPLTAETRGAVAAAELAALRPEATLVNVARGEIVDEEAVLAALDHGRLGTAILDVFAEEPLPEEHPFWLHPDVRVTPHVAAPSEIEAIADEFAVNYRRARAGEPLRHRVDPERGY